MPRAGGTFEIGSRDERPYDERDGVRLCHERLTETLDGGPRGTGTTGIITAIAEAGSAGHVGFERLPGTADGREGSFVPQHNAEGSGGGDDRMTWRVRPGSGSGAPRGIRGEGRITVKDGRHFHHLGYEPG